MKIPGLLAKKQTISFEFFPPKDPANLPDILSVMEELKALRPDFVSITFGAGGSTIGCSEELALRAQRKLGMNVMSHLTLAGQTRQQNHDFLERIAAGGIQNVIALRGDLPQTASSASPASGGFEYTHQLIGHIRERFDVAIGAACYPEGHPDSPGLDADIEHTKRKVDAGADFLVTQLFFDNIDYFRLLERAHRAGITVPIIAGILPVLDASQARRFAARCGATIPPALNEGLERYSYDSAAVREFGIEYTTAQVSDLRNKGVAGVHFYVLNRTYSVTKIFRNLGLVKQSAD
ncbi:MAG: methylenetetrahydrofolate reductase [NAD(P)H] [SAR202 cluster bacterium]|nr:methylenetetrahydrofolate reductase [NAD(P)H] [SAR202 cluster bacterium]